MQKKKYNPGKFDRQKFLETLEKIRQKRKEQQEKDYPLLENPWIDIGGEG